MIKQNQRILNILNLISDVALTFLAYYVSVVIRFRLMDGVWTIDLLSREFFQVIGAYCVVQLLLLYMLGVYVPQRYRRIRYELFAIVYVNALCMLLMVAWFYIWRIHDVSRTMMGFFYCLSSLMICSKHLVVRIVMRGVRSMGFTKDMSFWWETATWPGSMWPMSAKMPRWASALTDILAESRRGILAPGWETSPRCTRSFRNTRILTS